MNSLNSIPSIVQITIKSLKSINVILYNLYDISNFDLGHDIKLECFDKKKNGQPDIHLNGTGADLLARRILTHTSVLPNEYFEFEL